MIQLLSALPFVKDVIGMFAGDRVQREQQEASDVQQSKSQFAAELSYAAGNRNWFDAFVDGLSRLPRPLMAFGVIGFFVWAMEDPHSFTVRMQALQYVPEMMWILLLSIIGMYFPIRSIEKLGIKAFKAPPVAPADFFERFDPPKPAPTPAPVQGPSEEQGIAPEAPKRSRSTVGTLPPLLHPNPSLEAWRIKLQSR